MFDETASLPTLERVHGEASVHISAGRLRHLHQAGAAKAMLPRMHGAPPEVVFLNTAGGVTGGDRLRFGLTVDAGHAIGTTQTAERAYRSPDGAANVTVDLKVGAEASLDWLPQETILFEGAALHRVTRAELAGDAELILVDALVFGRAAMGETVGRLHLRDRREVWRDGKPVLLEPVRMDDADLTRAGAAGLSDARAVAALHLLAPDAADRLARLRAVLPAEGAAASAWNGRLSARFVARDPAHMRAALARAIPAVTGRPLPRVWPR